MKTAICVAGGVALMVLQPDAARVLADMRQALGGDAAIAALKSFSVSGSESHSLGGFTSSSDIEFLCALPDRFLHVRRWSSSIGGGTEEWGFNGDARIRRRNSDLPYPPDPGESDTPAEKAQRDAVTLAHSKREFARIAIAMIGISAIDPVDVSFVGQETVDGKTADVLALSATDGYVAKLFVDASTHLPLMISWMGTPIVTATSSSVVAVRQGQMPGPVSAPSFPPLPDPRSLPPVQHQLLFGDYKTADGFTWPHTLTEKVSGRVYNTIKLGKFKINSKIDDKRFDPSRR